MAGVFDPGDIVPMRSCVILDGRLSYVLLTYDAATGDSLYQARRYAEVLTDSLPYAARQPWYVNSEVITVEGLRLVKFGLPRVLGDDEVVAVGDYRGVTLFAEPGMSSPRDVVYVPVRPGCEFQPYQYTATVRAVRG